MTDCRNGFIYNKHPEEVSGLEFAVLVETSAVVNSGCGSRFLHLADSDCKALRSGCIIP